MWTIRIVKIHAIVTVNRRVMTVMGIAHQSMCDVMSITSDVPIAHTSISAPQFNTTQSPQAPPRSAM